MSKSKQKRIPVNSLAIIIKFKDKDSLKEMKKTEEWSEIDTKLSNLAHKFNAEFKSFVN